MVLRDLKVAPPAVGRDSFDHPRLLQALPGSALAFPVPPGCQVGITQSKAALLTLEGFSSLLWGSGAAVWEQEWLGAVPLSQGEGQAGPGAEEWSLQQPGSTQGILELFICLCLRAWRLWCLEQCVSRLGTLLLRCSVPLAQGVCLPLSHLAPAGNPGKCLLSQPLGEEKHLNVRKAQDCK